MNALPSNAPAYSSLNIATLSQQARLLRVSAPLDAELVAERMTLREGVSRLFSLTLDCLAASAEIDVAALLGKEITVSLLQADGSMRRWHAVVEGVDALGTDGGLARYRLHAAPWMAALALRRDSFIYQDLSVQDIVSEVFADYPQAAFAFELTDAPAPRATCTQYRESDLDFVARILAEAGLSYRFEHLQDDAQASGGGARHRVVIFDADAARPEDPASPLRFHRSDATETSDSITRFAAAQAVRPNAVARAAWNERTLTAHAAQTRSQVQVEALPVLEDYDYAGHGRYADDDAAEKSVARSLRTHESRLVRFDGAGTVRSLAPGRLFALTQHERYAQGGGGQAVDELGGNRYALLEVIHEATNNLGGQAAQVLNTPDMERGTYRNRFSAQPEAAALMPIWRPRPTAPEGLAAVVVSASDASITSDRDLRVKVQFPWQRGDKPLPGGLPHRTHGDTRGNAPGDERSGTWLRVASAQAGPNWGAHHLPRSGTEVIVEFIDGDIDQPVVAGQLYNDADLPPWSAGENGDANHAGVLSGWHSQGLDGAGRNQWVFDDTKGKLRTRLASSTAATQLGLGYLVEQELDAASRGQWRGTGFELRSDAWAVVRSGQGMLVSATAREQGKSTQADAQEALLLLRGAQDASRRLNDSAGQHQARPLAAAEGYDALLQALDPEQEGRYTPQVNGQAAGKAASGQRTGDAPVERINGPHLFVDAPNSLNLATPASAVLHAGEHLHTTAQSDAHVAAQQTYAAVSARSASVFAQQGPIRAISAQAPVSLHAHTDILEALAGQDITVTSSAEGIEILGNQRVTLQAAGGSVTLDGADIVFKGPGLFSVKGATHNFVGPGSDAANLPALPSTTVDDPLIVSAELVHKDGVFATAAKKAGASLMAGFGGAGTAGAADNGVGALGAALPAGLGELGKTAAGAASKLSQLAGQANTLAGLAKNPMGALSAAPGLLGGAGPAVGGLLNTAKNTMGMVSQVQAMIANPMSALPAASGLLGSVAPGAGGMIDSATAAAGTVTKAAELIKNPMAAMPAATDMLASVAPEGASKMISSAATFAGVGTGTGAATGGDGGVGAGSALPGASSTSPAASAGASPTPQADVSNAGTAGSAAPAMTGEASAANSAQGDKVAPQTPQPDGGTAAGGVTPVSGSAPVSTSAPAAAQTPAQAQAQAASAPVAMPAAAPNSAPDSATAPALQTASASAPASPDASAAATAATSPSVATHTGGQNTASTPPAGAASASAPVAPSTLAPEAGIIASQGAGASANAGLAAGAGTSIAANAAAAGTSTTVAAGAAVTGAGTSIAGATGASASPTIAAGAGIAATGALAPSEAGGALSAATLSNTSVPTGVDLTPLGNAPLNAQNLAPSLGSPGLDTPASIASGTLASPSATSEMSASVGNATTTASTLNAPGLPDWVHGHVGPDTVPSTFSATAPSQIAANPETASPSGTGWMAASVVGAGVVGASNVSNTQAVSNTPRATPQASAATAETTHEASRTAERLAPHALPLGATGAGMIAAVATTIAAAAPLRARGDADRANANANANANAIADAKDAQSPAPIAQGTAEAQVSTKTGARDTRHYDERAENNGRTEQTDHNAHYENTTHRRGEPPNAALLSTLAAGAGALFSATASAASSATHAASVASVTEGALPATVDLPAIASQSGTAQTGPHMPDAIPGISPDTASVVATNTAMPATDAALTSMPTQPGSDTMLVSTPSLSSSDAALTGTPSLSNSAPSLSGASAQTPGFVPAAGTNFPQGAGLPGMQEAGGMAVPGAEASTSASAAVGAASASTAAAAASATTSASAATAATPAVASGAGTTLGTGAGPGLNTTSPADTGAVAGAGSASGGIAGTASATDSNAGAIAGTRAGTSADTAANSTAPGAASVGTAESPSGAGTGASPAAPSQTAASGSAATGGTASTTGAGTSATTGTTPTSATGATTATGATPASSAATPPATATPSVATAAPAGTAAPSAPAAPSAASTSAGSPDSVLGNTTARAAGMADSTPATRATDLSAAGGAGTAAGATTGASSAGVAGIGAVGAGGGLATFAQQASAASTALSSASTFAAGGVSASVSAAIVPVMTQALNASGDRMAALGSAVDTLFTLPDVKQANIPSVAGAILSMPGLSSSSVPGVIGAILQSPTLATETLPKVAEVLMKIPGVADSPLPQIARDVLDTIGLGPVARTQGTNLPGDTPAPSGSGRVVPGVSTYRARQDGARLQYVNLDQVADRWNDGSALTTTERQSNRPRIHVEFNRPGQHRFTITVKPDPANIPYSARERGRRASYQEPHSNPRSYVTNADGTRIVDDITLPAAGLNLYLFEVRDERGQLIKTERVETVRRLYIQEVMCMSPRPAGHLADVTPVTAEFALHGIDMIQLPRVQFRGRSAVNAADDADAQHAIMQAVRQAYTPSAGKQREPYTLVVCHVDRLVAPGVSGDMRLPVPAGPGGRVMTVPIVNDDRSQSPLWYEFDQGDDWLVHARYLYRDASGAERSLPIPRHLITPIRDESGGVWSVSVDLTQVSPTPLTGMLNIQFNTVAASYAGLAITGTNLLFVSTLDPFVPNSQAYLTETLAHEMGHLLGMVPSGPDWPGLRNVDTSADDSKLDPPTHFYYNMGGHCYFGLPDQNGQYNQEIGQCVMYGITCANIHFCPSCSKAVRKVDCSEGWTSF
jgi:type VI secretion system VgrG family protein